MSNHDVTGHDRPSGARRVTRQRHAVERVIAQADDHPTAEQIHERVRERVPAISLGTVYRNLGVLVEESRIVELISADNVRHYDVNEDEHVHVICTACGKIVDVRLPSELQKSFRSSMEQASGYRLEGESVEARGTCPACLSP